ncbi:MAG: hypothetical protein K8953_12595, partial [Proteobacteria bacterium]|nr:hypothetical protein [Pseudomonadota bacterium]
MPFELPSGVVIKVDEFRKEVRTGVAVIRSGYMRIDDSPRFQIVMLFNNVRVMDDRPIFHNFNDAQDAADEWLAKHADNPPVRRLTALPSPEAVPVVHKPKTYRIKARPRPQPVIFTSRQRCHHSKLGVVGSAKLDEITIQEYHKLDFARSSLRQLHATVSALMGVRITEPMLQQR